MLEQIHTTDFSIALRSLVAGLLVARGVSAVRGLSARKGRCEPLLLLTLGTTFNLNAGLGRAPAVTSVPLPALKVRDAIPDGVDLTVPVLLPFDELSRMATAYAARETVTLPVPTSPTVQATRVTVKPAGPKLLVTVQVQVRGPLGLKVNATVDVTGTPKLDATGRTVTLEGVTVRTRREGLSGKVISLLADARAQAYVTRAARFDLTPSLEKARAQAQAKLPMTPTPGLQLGGTVGPMSRPLPPLERPNITG